MLKKIRGILAESKSREAFFGRIEMIFPTMDCRYVMIERAYNAAEDAFHDKYRDGGEKYFEHLRATTLIIVEYLRITDYEIIVAGLLHDILEDIKSWNIQRVRAEFTGRVALLLEYVSKAGDGKYPTKEIRVQVYFNRFRFAPREVFIIKLPDVLHNMLTIWECTEEKRLRKIDQVERHYMYYAEREIILIHELEAALSELRNGCPIEAKVKEKK